MKEQILQWVTDYAPVVLMLVMCFIDRFGFGNTFSDFRKEITDSLNLKKLKKDFEQLQGDLRSVYDELKETKDELKKAAEGLKRVKGERKQ